MREASTRKVDTYIASVRDRLRSHPEGGTGPINHAEAHQQKRYYDRKVGAVNLKPGDPGTSEGRCLEGTEED